MTENDPGRIVVGSAKAAARQVGVSVRLWQPGRPAKPPSIQWRYQGVNTDGRRVVSVWVWWQASDPTATDEELVAYCVAFSDLLRLQLLATTGWSAVRNQQVGGLRARGANVEGLPVDGMVSVWTEP